MGHFDDGAGTVQIKLSMPDTAVRCCAVPTDIPRILPHPSRPTNLGRHLKQFLRSFTHEYPFQVPNIYCIYTAIKQHKPYSVVFKTAMQCPSISLKYCRKRPKEFLRCFWAPVSTVPFFSTICECPCLSTLRVPLRAVPVHARPPHRLRRAARRPVHEGK